MPAVIELSEQQRAIVELPLEALSVTACAGSGKTKTAVHRLAEMRARLDDDRGMVALLSFSNVAVDTFKRDYLDLGRSQAGRRRSMMVEIDTVDGFITGNILRPHGHREMGCDRTPFLVEGREPFLKSFTVFDGERSNPIADLQIRTKDRKFEFGLGRNFTLVDRARAISAMEKLGKVGAYTHEIARYWVIRTLKAQPFVLRALARRYPQILIDEAQDIGPMHEAILQILVKAGSVLSLIGDANQGIYEFSGANGRFLAEYGRSPGVTARDLKINYRSVPAILEIANTLCGREDKPDRGAPRSLHGAFYFPYKKTEKAAALAVFGNMLAAAKIAEDQGIVLCRSADWADDWGGGGETQGQGTVRAFTEAVVYRDRQRRFDKAFRSTCIGISGLLDPRHSDLTSRLTRGTLTSEFLAMKREIWSFARNPDDGLPCGHLLANSEWHPLLLRRIREFLNRLSTTYGLGLADNLGARLAKRALDDRPLVEAESLAEPKAHRFRVSTVHKVKGESLEAVMYVARKEHIRALLDGTQSELGRIGYVALTRARNLFVLAVPDNALNDLEADLEAKGFRRAGAVA